jgi:hypothetical protein
LKTIFIVLDHGLALAYFLQTGLTRMLLERKDIRLVFLVQDSVLALIKKEYEHLDVTFESMRENQVHQYIASHMAGTQELIDHVRWSTLSPRIPLTYVDTSRRRKEYEAKGRRKQVLLALRPVITVLRKSRAARQVLRRSMNLFFTPHIYDDLFERYQPDLVISNTAGWRLDTYLLREANRRGIRTATVIVGWDNPSSQGLPGAFIEYANVWSEVHRWELVDGVDWPEDKINIGGMPLYDGYINHQWVIPREEYFKMYGLDPGKRLIAYAATALSISPNYHIVKALVDLVSSSALEEPAQLLIRLHPNHFKPLPHYREECEKIIELASHYPSVHVVEPKEVAGGLERYSGEDFPEKASMLTHCDVLVTIYSTMVVEAALHDKPFISVCIDSPEGWKDKFWIPLSQVPSWPTAARVNKMKAGATVFTIPELAQALNRYLKDPTLDSCQRREFIQSELTYLNGEATRKTADFLLSLVSEKNER